MSPPKRTLMPAFTTWTRWSRLEVVSGLDIDEVIGRDVDEVVFDLGGDVSQEGDFQPRPSDRADAGFADRWSGITWYRADDLHVGPGDPALGVGEPLTHRVADASRTGRERTITEAVVGAGRDDRLVSVGVATHERPGAVDLRAQHVHCPVASSRRSGRPQEDRYSSPRSD